MIVLRQRSYSIFQELYHSGAKRVKKKYLGRLRRGVAEKAGQIARDSVSKNIKLVRNIESGRVEDISNQELGRKLVRAAREKANARVFDNDLYVKVTGRKSGNFNELISDSNKSLYKTGYESGRRYTPRAKKVLKSMIDRRNIINLEGSYKDSVATLAHEIGHAMNNSGTAGEKRRAISRLDGIKRRQNLKDKGILDTIKNRLTILKEESNAWDNGIKLLKENGASKKEIDIAKKNRDAALGTYKSNSIGRVGSKIFKKYSPEGINKKIGLSPDSVSGDREKILKVLGDRFEDNIPYEEIKELANNMKTDRQLYRQQKLRKARRKDKSIMREIFGNW